MLTRHRIFVALLATAGLVLGCAAAPDRPPPDTAGLTPPQSQGEMAVESDPTQITESAGVVPHSDSPAPSALSLPAELPEGEEGEEIRKGWAIFDATPEALRAAAERKGYSYDGNALSCRNCHLNHGTRSGALPLMNFTEEKRYSPREGLVISGAQRINSCLQRSLNAPPLPDDSPELGALTTYLNWIAQHPFETEGDTATVRDFPDRTADFVTGEDVFFSNCAFCHGGSEGTAPPLWGPQSFPVGSDMNRLLIAAAFVKANMPPEGATLSLGEAYDVAAFVNSLERSYRRGLERDYPALTKKPVDSPYPPYPDAFFTQEQHQFGPFGPIIEKRELQRQADRWVYWIEHGTSADQHGIMSLSETE